MNDYWNSHEGSLFRIDLGMFLIKIRKHYINELVSDKLLESLKADMKRYIYMRAFNYACNLESSNPEIVLVYESPGVYTALLSTCTGVYSIDPVRALAEWTDNYGT